MRIPLHIILIGVLVLIGVTITLAAGQEPVSRVRLERFARRQRLTVTVANGNQVIRYLATTRRWRATGLAVGAVVSIVIGVPIHFASLFTGWFLGALVAEVRVAHLAHSPRRAASLRERRPEAYLSRAAWALVPATAVVAVAVTAGTGVAAALGGAAPDWTAWLWPAVAVVLAGVVRAVQTRVLRRPQPLAEPDLLAADDAIRSRSLHVLAGGGAALVLYCVLAQLDGVHPASVDAREAIASVRGPGAFVVAALGWSVATAVWPPRRAAPRPAPTATT